MNPQTPSQKVPIQYLLAIFACCIIALFFAQFLFFNKQDLAKSKASEIVGTRSLITPQPTPCAISGQVLDMGSVAPDLCPTEGGLPGDTYKGVNFLTVRLIDKNNVSKTTITNTKSGQNGVFSFPDVPAGVYQVCAEPPGGYQHFCNVPRIDGKTKIATSECALIDTAVACTKVNLNIIKRSTSSQSPN